MLDLPVLLCVPQYDPAGPRVGAVLHSAQPKTPLARCRAKLLVHAGHAAVGEVGWQHTRTFTAVGDTVNTAARLQELCKGYGVRLVASEQVLQGAKMDTSRLARHTISVRGRTEDLVIYAVASPSELRSACERIAARHPVSPAPSPAARN